MPERLTERDLDEFDAHAHDRKLSPYGTKLLTRELRRLRGIIAGFEPADVLRRGHVALEREAQAIREESR